MRFQLHMAVSLILFSGSRHCDQTISQIMALRVLNDTQVFLLGANQMGFMKLTWHYHHKETNYIP